METKKYTLNKLHVDDNCITGARMMWNWVTENRLLVGDLGGGWSSNWSITLIDRSGVNSCKYFRYEFTDSNFC